MKTVAIVTKRSIAILTCDTYAIRTYCLLAVLVQVGTGAATSRAAWFLWWTGARILIRLQLAMAMGANGSMNRKHPMKQQQH